MWDYFGVGVLKSEVCEGELSVLRGYKCVVHGGSNDGPEVTWDDVRIGVLPSEAFNLVINKELEGCKKSLGFGKK